MRRLRRIGRRGALVGSTATIGAGTTITSGSGGAGGTSLGSPGAAGAIF